MRNLFAGRCAGRLFRADTLRLCNPSFAYGLRARPRQALEDTRLARMRPETRSTDGDSNAARAGASLSAACTTAWLLRAGGSTGSSAPGVPRAAPFPTDGRSPDPPLIRPDSAHFQARPLDQESGESGPASFTANLTNQRPLRSQRPRRRGGTSGARRADSPFQGRRQPAVPGPLARGQYQAASSWKSSPLIGSWPFQEPRISTRTR